ncbi:MAG: hypothetical protein KA314_04665 [Chloroflexi bacterium]|nr:hypothetical protein [Chloroflexota bacterium]
MGSRFCARVGPAVVVWRDGGDVKLKAPFPWIGGKGLIMPMVWRDYLGDPLNTVIPFGGSFADLWTRPQWDTETGSFSGPRPYRTETVNDANAFLINAFRAIQAEPEAVAQWCDWPVSEADQHARHAWLCGFTPEPESVPAEFDKPGLREAWLAGWKASYQPFDPLVFRERVMSDPFYYDAQVGGWWIWGQCVWIGSGWCDWEWIERRQVKLERKRTNVHQTGIMRKDIRLRQQRPTLRPAQGIESFRLKRQRPHITDNRGLMSLARQIPSLSGSRGATGTGITAVGLRYNVGLVEFLKALAARLMNVHVVCGAWDRVLSPSATYLIGETAVVLDPPYDDPSRDPKLYAVEDQVLRGRKDGDKSLSQAAREWALANGDNPKLKIALFGYETEHQPHMPESWRCVAWKGSGGYGNRNADNQNRHKERVWLSPHCLYPEQHIVVRPAPVKAVQATMLDLLGVPNGKHEIAVA